jgi:outer membrane biogenesis lipoprotein LolB
MYMKLQLLISAIAFSLLTGCASKSSVSQLRADLDDTRQISEQALATAKEAKQIASEADERSRRSEEVLNRGFKRSMYK